MEPHESLDPTNEPVDHARLAKMMTAVELEVDHDEFEFHSEQERALWLELEAEFHDRLAREGRVWIALDAA